MQSVPLGFEYLRLNTSVQHLTVSCRSRLSAVHHRGIVSQFLDTLVDAYAR